MYLHYYLPIIKGIDYVKHDIYLCCYKTYPLLGNIPISEIWPRKHTHAKNRKRTGYVFSCNYGI